MNNENMYDTMRKALNTLKNRLGEEIFTNPVRFANALNDLATGMEANKAKNLLRIAVCDIHAYARLKKAYAINDNFALFTLAKEMAADFMIPIDVSTEVMSCLAVLVGFQPSNTPWQEPAEFLSGIADAPDNIVRLGPYDWRVLHVQGGRALMLCDKVIEKRRYHEKLEIITWENCTLRKYLNGEFYNAFSKEEQARILSTKSANPNNPWFSAKGGKETIEKISLLNINDVVRYFGDSGQMKNKSNKYLIDDRFNHARKAVDIGGATSWWWLRSPGEGGNFAAYVCTAGMIHMNGSLVSISGGAGGGIRPALWLNLQG